MAGQRKLLYGGPETQAGRNGATNTVTALDPNLIKQEGAHVDLKTNPSPAATLRGRLSKLSQQAPTVRRWPLMIIAAPAAVAIWSGWVGLGSMCGFGLVQPFPGIVSWHLDTAITLPVGVEAYGAYALGVWISERGVPDRARNFARWSAIGALATGAAGQVIFHLLAAAGWVRAPWPVVTLVACLPIIVVGLGFALTHMLRDGHVTARETLQVTAERDRLAGLVDEIASAIRAVPEAVAGKLPQPAIVPDNTRQFEELAREIRELRGAVDGQEPQPVPTSAEHAAELAYERTKAAGNPFTANALRTRFGISRAVAERIAPTKPEPASAEPVMAVNGSAS